MNPPVLGPELDRQPTLQGKQARREDVKFAAGKIAVFQYAGVLIFLFLITGFWNLQVQNPQMYNEQAERNSIKALPIPAPRGKILDRDGRVIVDNHPSYSLILTRENLKTEHLRTVADGLNLDYDDLAARVRRYTSRPKYDPIVIKEELTPADLSFVESHRDFFFDPIQAASLRSSRRFLIALPRLVLASARSECGGLVKSPLVAPRLCSSTRESPAHAPGSQVG